MRYGWSQYSYDGNSACTAIATFCAASFADGFAPRDTEERLKTLTAAGCKLWADHHRRSQSVQEVVASEPFFANYKRCSWQCGDHPGAITLAELLAAPEFGAENWGAVLTGGGSSIAIGRNGDRRFAFDSHGPRATWDADGRLADYVEPFRGGAVDVTQFRR